ncbi:MAG: hypothetical protein ACYTE8_05520 [Planctomycetota bacterium]|jgi:hypothetical protein
MKMTKVLMILAIGLLIVLCGCGGKYKKVEESLDAPINCATAEGDIRMLQHEKTHTADQIAAGVSSISPAGAVIGLVTGTEGASLKVTTGEYNKMIDKRIAEIKEHCGIE